MSFNRLFVLCLYYLVYCVDLTANPRLPCTDLHDLKDDEDYRQIGDEFIENLPELFTKYEKELGFFQKERCYQGVIHVYYQSLLSNERYEFYYTNNDACDGGNAYGLILGKDEKRPSLDSVIGIIRDSSCEPLH